MSNSAKSLRCTTCNVNWPLDASRYGVCPQCHGATWQSSSGDPIGDAEARSIKAHADFERYCAKRDADRDRTIAQFEQQLA